MTMPDGRPDAGPAALDAVVAHLDACNAAEYYADNPDEWEGPGPLPESPAVGYGCMGCETCTAREALAAAWPHVVDDVAELLRRAGHPAAAALVDAEAARVRADVAPQPTLQEVPA